MNLDQAEYSLLASQLHIPSFYTEIYGFERTSESSFVQSTDQLFAVDLCGIFQPLSVHGTAVDHIIRKLKPRTTSHISNKLQSVDTLGVSVIIYYYCSSGKHIEEQTLATGNSQGKIMFRY